MSPDLTRSPEQSAQRHEKVTAFPLFCFQIKILHVPHEKSLFLDTVKPSENRSIGGYSNTVHGHINNHNYYSVCPNHIESILFTLIS